MHNLAQSRTIAHNPEAVDCPSSPSAPRARRAFTSTLRFGTRTDCEQHIEDKIHSAEEKLR
jgi:hypothetical protein